MVLQSLDPFALEGVALENLSSAIEPQSPYCPAVSPFFMMNQPPEYMVED
jgi:hypothetical protein